MAQESRVVAAILAALLCCTGCYRSFTHDLAFQPPQGWIYAPTPDDGQVWVKPKRTHESIMAKAIDKPTIPKGRDWKHITICGNHPAMLEITTDVDPGQIWEGVSTIWGSKGYMAVYVKPLNIPPDPAAEVAIRSLCLRTP